MSEPLIILISLIALIFMFEMPGFFLKRREVIWRESAESV